MNETEPPSIRLHEDAELFREAVSFTSARTGFAARLIERDYFCTVLLAYLTAATSGEVIFKGGTCLAKVLASFTASAKTWTSPYPCRLTPAAVRAATE